MSQAEREEFLARVHVGVLAVESPDGPPVVTPVWYLYEVGGDVLIQYRHLDEEVHAAARAAGRATLCTQREELPYAYVTVDGPVTIEPSTEEFRLEMALRYVDEGFAKGYVESTAGEDHVMIRLAPRQWHTTDYGKLE